VLGALVAVMLLMAGCVALVVTLARGPIEASNDFVAMLDEGRLDAAYDSLDLMQPGPRRRANMFGGEWWWEEHDGSGSGDGAD